MERTLQYGVLDAKVLLDNFIIFRRAIAAALSVYLCVCTEDESSQSGLRKRLRSTLWVKLINQ